MVQRKEAFLAKWKVEKGEDFNVKKLGRFFTNLSTCKNENFKLPLKNVNRY